MFHLVDSFSVSVKDILLTQVQFSFDGKAFTSLLDFLCHRLKLVDLSPELSFFVVKLIIISVNKVSLLFEHTVVFPQLLIVKS
jgi:hypothetical protein